MPEIETITLTYKEVVEALVKYQNLHEGIWQLYIEFGIAAANVATGPYQASPSAIVPVSKIGLHRVNQENSLAVDASKVNPIKE
jgi:hypothetical protein